MYQLYVNVLVIGPNCKYKLYELVVTTSCMCKLYVTSYMFYLYALVVGTG